MTRARLCWAVAASCPAALRRAVSGNGDDRGSSSVEFAILLPILAVLIFGGPQLAMWYFAREAAVAAAQAGARAASANGAPAGSGAAAATSYLTSTASGTTTGATPVTEDDTNPATVTVRVQATVVSVIPLPGLTFTIDVSSTRARERFTNPGTP